MSDELPKPVSIRRLLLLFLISSAVLMVSGAAAVTYFVALRSANNAYDRSLLDPALDIADNVKLDVSGAHVDLPQKALEALVYDQVDKVRGMDITITTTARDDKAGRALLSAFSFPFRK